ncbi:hypothetical protein MNBD_IGNAVI01-1812 [hydrothermal vent metagenome]|uniref:Uncharacterized protein n=1 Tax=hydrothermal vent metagenome TaxID=652676 RepID=A0A3B1D1K2_9ZZZZ
MTEKTNDKPKYDLEERTFQFAKSIRSVIKTLPKTIANNEHWSFIKIDNEN